MKLTYEFFQRDVRIVAKELLGNFIVRHTKYGSIVGKIVETEAYGDVTDLASHARFGPTKRNKPMFGHPGHLYVYLIYGIFDLTNIVCESPGQPGAVLIRAAEITEGHQIATTNLSCNKFTKPNEYLATGPGKFSAAFGISTQHNNLDLTKSDKIHITKASDSLAASDIIEAARIGVDYAKHCRDYPWRYYIKNNPFVSKAK